MGDSTDSYREGHGRGWRWLETVVFLAALAILSVVVYSSFVVQGNRQAQEQAGATATAQGQAALTAAPQATAAARGTARAQDLVLRQSTPVPLPAERISVENAGRVREVARWGRGMIEQVAWSPDGRLLAVGTTIGVYLYDPWAGLEVRFLDTRSWAMQLVFSPDGQTLAVALTNRTGQLWQVADGTLLRTLDGLAGPVYGVGFSYEGALLAAGVDLQTGGLWLWRDGAGVVLRTPANTANARLLADAQWMSMAISPDGQTLAAAWPIGLGLWRVGQKGSVIPSESSAGATVVLSFSPDGALLAAALEDGTTQLWRVADGTPVRTVEEGMGWLKGLAFSPDGQRLVSAGSRTVRLWNVADGTMLRLWEQEQDGNYLWPGGKVAFSPDGRFLALGNLRDNSVTLRRVEDGAVLQRLPGFSIMLIGLALSPDGQLIAGRTLSEKILLWGVEDAVPLLSLDRPEGSFSISGGAPAFSPDGRLLACGGVGAVTLWQTSDGTFTRTLRSAGPEVIGVAFSPDGKYIAGCQRDAAVLLWETAGGTLEDSLAGNRAPAPGWCDVAFSPDSQFLAVAPSDGAARLWRVADRTLLSMLAGSQGGFGSLAFSPDGQLLAAWSVKGTVRLWRVADGALERTLEGDTEQGMGLAFSPDGQILAGGMAEGSVRLWRVADGVALTILEGHSLPTGVAFTPDGRLLVSTSADGTIRLWGVSR